MVPNVSVKTYRPRQQVSFREERRSNTRFSFSMSGKARKYSAILVAVALVAGLTITQFFHGQMTDMRVRAEQVRAKNTAVGNENVRLLAVRAQLASKTHIAALVGTKLNLFEPGKGQVRRM